MGIHPMVQIARWSKTRAAASSGREEEEKEAEEEEENCLLKYRGINIALRGCARKTCNANNVAITQCVFPYGEIKELQIK